MTTRRSSSPAFGTPGTAGVSPARQSSHLQSISQSRPQSQAQSPSQSQSQSHAQRSKRQKIFRACATCVTSKTRCEDVNADGCSLCRRRGRMCSLAAIASAIEGKVDTTSSSGLGSSSGAANGQTADAGPNTGGGWNTASSTPLTRPRTSLAQDAYPSPAASSLEDLQHRLAEAERRVARTEAAMLDLEAQLAGPSDRGRRGDRDHGYGQVLGRRRRSPSQSHSPRSQPEDHVVEVTGPLRLGTLLLYRVDETMFSVGSTRMYPHPVSRGVVPAAHAELAWHAFKARISALLPLPPFLAVTTPVPVHGFVMLAALAHVPGKYTPALEPLLNESILLAMSSAASVDVMLALLILSLAPLPPDTQRDQSQRAAPCVPSAYRLISLAYQMGQSLGYETMAEAALARGQDLNREWFGEHLWNLQLWAATVNRFCLLSLMNGQIATLPRRIGDRLPALLRDSVEMCNRHLRAEATVIDMFVPIARLLCSLEHVDEYPHEALRPLPIVWKTATDLSVEFQRDDNQPPSVQRDALSVQFVMGLRIASLTTWIPSPLRDARELALPSLSQVPATMTSMLNMITGEGADPASYPSYTIMLTAAALICFRRAVQFVRIAYRQTSLIDPDILDATEERLMGHSHATRFFLTEANKLLAELPYPTTWQGAADPIDRAAAERNAAGGENSSAAGDDAAHHEPVPPGGHQVHIPFDFDIMNWDFSLLYPDLSSFGIMDTSHAPQGQAHQHQHQHQHEHHHTHHHM